MEQSDPEISALCFPKVINFGFHFNSTSGSLHLPAVLSFSFFLHCQKLSFITLISSIYFIIHSFIHSSLLNSLLLFHTLPNKRLLLIASIDSKISPGETLMAPVMCHHVLIQYPQHALIFTSNFLFKYVQQLSHQGLS